MASQVVLVIKHLTTNAGDIRDRTHGFDPWVKEILWRMARHETEHMGLIHGSRRHALEDGMATHSSILAWKIPMDKWAWRTTVHRVTKTQTWLKCFSTQTHTSMCVCLVTQLCPTLWDPMDCSPSVFSIHGDSPSRILEWVAMPSSRESSQPRDWTQVSCIAGGFFTDWTTREAPCISKLGQIGNGSSNIYIAIEVTTTRIKNRNRLQSMYRRSDYWFSL